MPNVQRTRGVSRYELQVNRLTRERVIAAIRLALLNDRLRERTSGSGIESDVDKAGACNIHRSNAVDSASLLSDFGCELARVCTQLLCQLHRNIGCPITVIAVARSLEHQIARGQTQIGRAAVSRNAGDDRK